MSQLLLSLILLCVAATIILVGFLLSRVSRGLQGTGKEVRDELRTGREEALHRERELREELSASLRSTGEALSRTLESMGGAQQSQMAAMTAQLKGLSDSNRQSLDSVRTTIDSRVKELQESNEKKLDEMRKTVDEKLHETLEKRLGESFKLVGDRLEAVHKDLGEMQNLATDLGDFKRVLTNVKTRGTWAEVQLGSILEEILTPDQYEKNVRVRTDSPEVVEYAVRLPGPREDPAACMWLPIDSKFPQEDYLRLQAAADKADPDAVRSAADGLARTARGSAKEIHDKYVNPPSTTDFAVMFLATEGLYAEVLRQAGLAEELQHRYRVIVAGPTTLAAILNSLRLGFQTLAIERRAVEVWRVLAAVKTEFGKFGGVLDRVKRHLETASRTVEETEKRSRAMERRLRSVEQLPDEEVPGVLALPQAGEEADAEEPQPGA
ncbi:MAG TPA: DNA recombination protein RmuC [Patescibacteria group bacterium]|nr:DNA recombination protein RmuC [Patescibacteria group bacterium]